jgi:hypothetical protein
MAFSEICNGHEKCTFCGARGPTRPRPGDEQATCCTDAGEVGFWDKVDVANWDGDPGVEWAYWHNNDECAIGGGR